MSLVFNLLIITGLSSERSSSILCEVDLHLTQLSINATLPEETLQALKSCFYEGEQAMCSKRGQAFLPSFSFASTSRSEPVYPFKTQGRPIRSARGAAIKLSTAGHTRESDNVIRAEYKPLSWDPCTLPRISLIWGNVCFTSDWKQTKPLETKIPLSAPARVGKPSPKGRKGDWWYVGNMQSPVKFTLYMQAPGSWNMELISGCSCWNSWKESAAGFRCAVCRCYTTDPVRKHTLDRP